MMLSLPEVIDSPVQAAAVIHLNVRRSEMMKIFGPAIAELMAVLAAQGVQPLGAVFAHHLAMTPEFFDFELGVRISGPLKAAGRVKPGALPAARVARTIYTGPYEGLPAAWGEFGAWIKASGHEPAEDLWEVYTTGPQSMPESAGWHTELNRPLKT